MGALLSRRKYKPKLLLILLLFLFLHAIVFVRLFLVQIHQQDFFGMLARQQYVTEITTKPPRALIYDRNGSTLAHNREKLSAFVLPHQFSDAESIKKILKKDFVHVYEKVVNKKKRRFFWLERHLDEKRLKVMQDYNSKDIHFLSEPERFYPSPTASHVVGFTNIDNVGAAGTELQFNRRLGGAPTTSVLEKDARSGHFYFKKDIKEKGRNGEAVTLSIDKNLQFFASRELEKTVAEQGAKGGGVLIMDPDSGHILAMASNPQFYPNKKVFDQLNATKNIVVTECFELGSVMKVFAALAALEEGVVTIDEEIDCEGKSTFIDGFRVENWKSLGPGLHPFWEVVARSNNVGIAKVAKRLGPKLHFHFGRLGFGSKTGIRFPGERSGFVNPPHNWSRSSLIVLSFGYEIMATLLQLGKAFSVVANGGFSVQPVSIIDPERKKSYMHGKRLYKKESIENLKEAMKLRDWIEKRYSIEGYKIFGKTGTARSVKSGRYSDKDHVYTYAGIVEKGDYKRVIITFVKEPKKAHLWATQISLPLFHEVAKKMLIYELGK